VEVLALSPRSMDFTGRQETGGVPG